MIEDTPIDNAAYRRGVADLFARWRAVPQELRGHVILSVLDRQDHFASFAEQAKSVATASREPDVAACYARQETCAAAYTLAAQILACAKDLFLEAPTEPGTAETTP